MPMPGTLRRELLDPFEVFVDDARPEDRLTGALCEKTADLRFPKGAPLPTAWAMHAHRRSSYQKGN